MALRPFRGFVGPSYTSESRIAAYDRTVNYYPEKIESGTGTAEYVLYPTPGFFTQVSGLNSPGRGGLTITGDSIGGSISGNTYFISGSTLYLYPSTSLTTGIVNGSGNPVIIVTNGDQGHQLLFASDSTTYCFDTTSHALTNVGTGHNVDFLGGYGLRLNTVTSEFSFSAPFDFSTWDPLDVVDREDASDKWRRIIVHHKEVWLLGAETSSVYYLSDDPDTPFKPIASPFIQVGIVAPNSACIVDGQLMWVGQSAAGSGIVYRANGYTPERISTHAVELAFQSATAGNLGSAEGCTYQHNGHVFYEITLPSPDAAGGSFGSTWVYDATEGLWAERGAFTGLVFREMDTRGYFGFLTLSRSSGKVYSISPTTNLGTDGAAITRLRRAPHLTQAQQLIRYSHLRVIMGTGLVTIVPPALSWTDNGGTTFGSTSVGTLGADGPYVDFRQLGQGRDRIFEFTSTSSAPLIDALLAYTVGPS